MTEARPSAVEILLIEDNPGDQRLTREAIKDGKIANQLHIVGDAETALLFLKKEGAHQGAPTPDLILLDLNLPMMSGDQLLKIIKNDPALKMIPVVILTTSKADEDILKVYNLNANCYITKPVDFEQFSNIVQKIEDFWFSIVRLPKR